MFDIVCSALDTTHGDLYAKGRLSDTQSTGINIPSRTYVGIERLVGRYFDRFGDLSDM